MFYAFSHKVNDTTADPAYTYPLDLTLPLTAGVIHQVDILFQDGCAHLVEVQLFQANFQLWPSNRGAMLKGNATVISFRDFYELVPGGSELTAKINAGATPEDVEVIIQIGLLPKQVLQPLSFEELMAAATGVE